MYTELLQTKEPLVDAVAFQRVLRTAREDKATKGKTNERPKEVSTGAGAELKGEFCEILEENGIAQRSKESTKSLAVIDGAIRTMKIKIAKEMTDTGGESWCKISGSGNEAL